MSQTHVGPNRESPPSTPRWVKVVWILFLILVLLAGIGLFEGDLDPRRQMPSAPTITTEHGGQRP
jgi:hypothetical protein